MREIDTTEKTMAAEAFARLAADEQQYLRDMGRAIGQPGWWLWWLNPQAASEEVRRRREHG